MRTLVAMLLRTILVVAVLLLGLFVPAAGYADTGNTWPRFPTDAEIDDAFARHLQKSIPDLVDHPGSAVVEKKFSKMQGGGLAPSYPAPLRSHLFVSFGVTHPDFVRNGITIKGYGTVWYIKDLRFYETRGGWEFTDANKSVGDKAPLQSWWATYTKSLNLTDGWATDTASSSPSPAPSVTVTPKPAAQLLVRATDLFLPPDGVSKSQIAFIWLEGDKPVPGKTVTFGWDGEGLLELPSGVTDADGTTTVTYTAPKLGTNSGSSVTIYGRGDGVPEAKIEIKLGIIGVESVATYSKSDRGGDHIGLGVVLSSKHTVELRNVPVELYDGNPATGGKLLGTQKVASLPANGTGRTVETAADVVVWEIGAKAEKRELFVRIPEVPGLAGAPKPFFERSFKVSNYGAPFKTNVDGYKFENYGKKAGTVEWLEDALAIVAANEKLSVGVRVLSYPALVQDFADTYGKVNVGGHCLGMATSAVAYFLDSGSRPAPGPTYGYGDNDPKIRGSIALYHVYQSTSKFKQAMPFGESRDPSAERLTQVRSYAAEELSSGRPLVLGMSGPNGGHAVVAYQMVEIEEFGVSNLMLYDNNDPYPSLPGGIAPVAAFWPSAGAFSYLDYNRLRLNATPKLPANAGKAFAGLAQTFAKQMMSEMTGGISPLRLITFRGPAEPVLVTPDGKRLGFVDGKPIAEIAGGKVVKLLDTYVFTVPNGLVVKLTGKATGDGTLTVGVASPDAGTAGRSVGLARPDPAALDAPAGVAAQLFDKVKVGSGGSFELAMKGASAALTVGGQPVPATTQESLPASAFGSVAQPTAAPAAVPPPVGPSAKPAWQDPLDGKADSGAATVSGPSASGKPATNGVAWVPGAKGQAASLGGDAAYLGYVGSRLKADQGTILLKYKPVPDLVGVYAKRHDAWTDYGQNKPPQAGFLIDTIGWNGAAKGAYGATLTPGAKSVLTWGVWDGSKWHNVTWTSPDGFQWDPNRWYEIGVTWGPKGLAILIDGEQKATIPDVVQINTSLPWFIGQAPWPWPYGPHSLLGTYDDLRVYAEQIGPYAVGGAGALPPASTSGATGGTGAATPAAGGALPPGKATEIGGAGPTYLGGKAAPNQQMPASLGVGTGSALAGTGASPAGATGGAGGSPGTVGVTRRLPPSGSALFDSVLAPIAAVVPPVNLAESLPGGSGAEVSRAVASLPGGAALLCSLPVLVLAGLVGLLLALLGFVAGRLGRPAKRQRNTTVSAPLAPVPEPPSAPPAAAAGARFCDRCGTAAVPGSAFCDNCGARF